MTFFRRAMASLLAFLLTFSCVLPGFAGEFVGPQAGTPEITAVKTALLPAATILPAALPRFETPASVPAETGVEASAMAALSQAQPPAGPEPTAKTGEASATEADRPFTGGPGSGPSPVPEPPESPREVRLEAGSCAAPLRSDMLVAWKKTGDEAARLKGVRAATWVKSGALILGWRWLAAAALNQGPATAKALLGAGIAYGAWLMVKLVAVTARIGRLKAQNQALYARLTQGEPRRTTEQAAERLEELKRDARRHELARQVEPQFAEFFAALKHYGVADEKLTEEMDYIRRFLSEVRTGERDHWTLNSMSYHLLGGSEDAIDALRAAVWRDRGVGVHQAMDFEDHVLDFRRSLSTEHQSGYRLGRELAFLSARMDEAYGMMPRVDLRSKDLVDRQIARLELEELREGRRGTARGLSELAKSFRRGESAASNRHRIDAILSSRDEP